MHKFEYYRKSRSNNYPGNIREHLLNNSLFTAYWKLWLAPGLVYVYKLEVKYYLQDSNVLLVGKYVKPKKLSHLINQKYI